MKPHSTTHGEDTTNTTRAENTTTTLNHIKAGSWRPPATTSNNREPGGNIQAQTHHAKRRRKKRKMQISTWSRTDQVCDAKTTHGRNTRRRAKTHRRETRHNHCHAGPKTHARPRALTERAQRQTLGHCHDQRDLDNTAGRTVENKRGTHLGMDGKQQRMPWLSMTHPPEMEKIR